MKFIKMLIEGKFVDDGGLLISGFPGVGKSTLVGKNKEILDSDSSSFDKKDFPDNYISHIKACQRADKIVLISSHDVVRNALINEKIPFVLVYPDKSQKEIYINRYKDRGSPEAFINLLEENFNKWVDECDSIDKKFVTKIRLKKDQFLADVLDDIITAHFHFKSPFEQRRMVEAMTIVAPLLKKFEKVTTVEAKTLKAGEEIVTVIDGEEETKNTAKEGDVLIKGIGGEKYVISLHTFKERYLTTDSKKVTKVPPTFTKFTSTGFAYAFQWKNPTMKFIAPWNEEMICNEGDFLATTSLDDIEVYRIESNIFKKTYKEV